MVSAERHIENISVKNNWKIILSALIFLVVLTTGSLYIIISPLYGLAIILVALLFLFQLNIKIIYSFLIISLFKTVLILELYNSLYIVPFIALSFLFTRSKISLEDTDIPISPYLFLYLFSMFISLVNTVSISGSLFKMLNYILFLLLIFLTLLIFRESKEIAKFLYLFLFLVFLNSIQVILLAGSGKREFGFAGIMFNDYVGLGSLLSIVLFFYTSKLWKIVFLILSIALTATMILTQTRGIWIAFASSFLLILTILLVKSERLFIRRNTLIFSFIIIIGIGGWFVLRSDNADFAAQRVASINQVDESAVKRGEVTNSVVTRFFIWHTCYNAFIQHPIIGIGAYSFPFSSQYYYTIPKLFYRKYVERLTPHVTYIAVLTETGLIGFLCFIFIIISILKLNYSNICASKNLVNVRYSIILLSANIYSFCSMAVTDSWLWGHGIILWGIIVGATAVHYKYLQRSNKQQILA